MQGPNRIAQGGKHQPSESHLRPFTTEELNDRISQLLTPKGMKAEVKIVFQSIEGLHASCPNHQGDWYFTGDFPTPGGHKVVNRAFVYYVEGRNDRAY